MKKTLILLAFGAVLVFIKCSSNETVVLPTSNWPGYNSFPAGYGYMDTAALQAAYNKADIPKIREHAWSLFAGIMQPSKGDASWPIWYTWPNSRDAFTAPLVSSTDKNALIEENKALGISLIAKNLKNTKTGIISDSIPLPYYPINKNVVAAYPKVCDTIANNINWGKHFMNNGDIMIPTESLSIEGFDWIRNNKLYSKKTLDSLYKSKLADLNAPAKYIVTKHMFWPVLAPSKQTYSAIPVWDEAIFNDSTSNKYAGYETWKRLVAVDPTNKGKGKKDTVSYLHGVFQPDSVTPIPTVKKLAEVHNINEFYSHKVTQADWKSFDDYDKAILNASSYWAYGKPFGVGDYLVTIAMHINTKEISTWALQSAWWSDIPNQSKYAANRPNLSAVTKDTTWKHYLLVDAYGIPVIDGNQLPVATNPYIELVIHPVATNCNNCHIRSGWPTAKYQDTSCPDMLKKLPSNEPCLKKYMRTDFQWIIPDHAH
jgi:hypothetical protein